MKKNSLNKKIFITGGLGFIGRNFIELITSTYPTTTLLIYDAKTYASHVNENWQASTHKNTQYIYANLNDDKTLKQTIHDFQPDTIIHFAAETHVDRSILSPSIFIESNINGTFHLLESTLNYWKKSSIDAQNNFRFIHISTDEVYGSLGLNDAPFTEHSPYAPNSPYSASKASSDHLVRAYYQTYGLPSIITHCSNNYGPYQHEEKLIPKIILNAIHGKPLPIYGNGQHIRDWLYVKDHCQAILTILEKGQIGETYNIGGNQEKSNLDIVQNICSHLDNIHPKKDGTSYQHQIKFVADRPGHDLRYAINHEKISRELGWQPTENFESGLGHTIQWYLKHFTHQ